MALLEAVSVSTVLFHRWISNTSGFGPLMTTCVLNDKLRALDLEVLLSSGGCAGYAGYCGRDGSGSA